ncbi:unnamed protein product [Caenorhabditis sp. 36 PRJEB53466]|nr:unnamed protein product [Caenorhabditis sp. 36 PRJEB53466]
MLDYRGIITSITGLAKTTFHRTTRRGEQNSSGNSSNSSSILSGPHAKRMAQRRGRERALLEHYVRQSSSSEEARDTNILAREAREDGMYTDENAADSPYMVVVSCYNISEKEEQEQQKKKKKKNTSQRDCLYDTDDETFEAEELNKRTARMPPPLSGVNPEIPNEYDPIIGIVSVQGVRIPRSEPIDIVPAREPLFPFFGVNTDLQIMLITERMYDVFKENLRVNGKNRVLTLMENLAMTLTIGQMCGRLLPVEMMDKVIYFYDFETVSFVSHSELLHLLTLCEPDQKDENEVAASVPIMFHRDTPKQVLERNKFYQELMNLPKIFLRCTDYTNDNDDFSVPFIKSADNEHNKILTVERQLNDDSMNHEEMNALIRTISQDLEEAERQVGLDFIYKSTLSLYDARVMVPPVN